MLSPPHDSQPSPAKSPDRSPVPDAPPLGGTPAPPKAQPAASPRKSASRRGGCNPPRCSALGGHPPKTPGSSAPPAGGHLRSSQPRAGVPAEGPAAPAAPSKSERIPSRWSLTESRAMAGRGGPGLPPTRDPRMRSGERRGAQRSPPSPGTGRAGAGCPRREGKEEGTDRGRGGKGEGRGRSCLRPRPGPRPPRLPRAGPRSSAAPAPSRGTGDAAAPDGGSQAGWGSQREWGGVPGQAGGLLGRLGAPAGWGIPGRLEVPEKRGGSLARLGGPRQAPGAGDFKQAFLPKFCISQEFPAWSKRQMVWNRQDWCHCLPAGCGVFAGVSPLPACPCQGLCPMLELLEHPWAPRSLGASRVLCPRQVLQG